MHESNFTKEHYDKTVNICGLYSSLEEEFEFYWSSLADELNMHFTKINQQILEYFHFCLVNFFLGTNSVEIHSSYGPQNNIKKT